MDESWRDRLGAALERAQLSKRGVSLKAGLGPGYLHSILQEGKDPTLDNLLAVCAAIGVSASWVVFGVNMESPEVEELARIWSRATPEQREGIRLILQAHKAA